MIKTKQLIKASQAGDLDAFEALLHLYQDRVYSHCIYLTNHAEDAKDLAQEVFIRAYRSIGTFRGEADFGTWLHRIAVNLWINQSKSKRSKMSVVSIDQPLTNGQGDELIREIAATDDSPYEVMEYQELLQELKTGLNQLPDEFRIVLVLRDIEGLSYEEIAKMLNCSLGTVKSRINRGRKALKAYFNLKY